MSGARESQHGRNHNAFGSDPVAGPFFDVETTLLEGQFDDGDSFDATYSFLNSWVNTGDPYAPFGYRIGGSGLEIQGHVKGGASGDPICIVRPDFRPLFNRTYLSDLGDIGSFVIARIEVVAATGEVIPTFPVSP